MNIRRLVAFLVSCLLAGATLGCGNANSGMRSVSGTVAFDGEPVSYGIIVLVPTDPKLSPDTGEIADGAFCFQAKPGPKKVQIRASREVGKSDMGPVMKEYIPPRYNANSVLQAEVKTDGPNEFEFRLNSKDE
jgi:hypothetical protein